MRMNLLQKQNHPSSSQPAAEADLEITSSEPVVEEQESVEIPGIASEDQEPEFPRAETGTGDVPSWIDGITGITDPNILEDFDFAPEQQEPSFPAAQNGEVADDDSIYKQRVIPEAMNAKLNAPTELPKTNGNQEHVPPKHDGPITIQASQADMQMFRNVLKGLSGTEVLSGDYEKPPEDPTKINGDSVATTNDGMNELRAAASETPIADEPIEVQSPEIPQTAPGEDPPAEAAPRHLQRNFAKHRNQSPSRCMPNRQTGPHPADRRRRLGRRARRLRITPYTQIIKLPSQLSDRGVSVVSSSLTATEL